MCTPAVIPAVVSIASTAVATGVQAKSRKRAAAFASAQERNNATFAGFERQDALERAASDASRVRAQGRQTAATARVAVSAGGLDPLTGSPAGVIAQSTLNAEQDAARIQANAARIAWNVEQQQSQFESKAKQQERAGVLGALGSGLSGLGSIAGQAGGIGRTVAKANAPAPIPRRGGGF